MRQAGVLEPSALVRLCELHCGATGLTPVMVGIRAAHNSSFFRRLKYGGHSCRMSTARRVVDWFSANWPDDVPWPADIPRPPWETHAPAAA